MEYIERGFFEVWFRSGGRLHSKYFSLTIADKIKCKIKPKIRSKLSFRAIPIYSKLKRKTTERLFFALF